MITQYSSSITHIYLNFSFSCLLLIWLQAAQLAYIIEDRLKEPIEDANREKALKDVAEATTKDSGKAVEDAEKRAQKAKRDRDLAEQKLAEMDAKLGGIKLKLAKAESLNLA